ncbi:DUF6074 family protein [Tianweitania populi]|uniref:Uncharacterized protein n=1 Tax=Tianweitania populi TaxID=1607949 RepID=A0A8J3GIH8_9HYPH|nr:DUF6074 family protein [Tianweitania populi]GHD07710.1 hypothetical protein GCM10016234_06440 [Tianweitania populi]
MNTAENDLPLFAWSPPSATMIPFPASKRVGKIRRVAEMMRQRQGKEKALVAYWSRVIDDMTSQLDRAGFRPETIAKELFDFEASVNAEMARLSLLDRYRTRP